MFCIKCGKNAVAGNFCRDCFLEREELFGIENFRMTMCNACGSYYDGPKKSEIGDAIKKRMKAGHNMQLISISYRKKGNRIIANIKCEGTIRSFKKTERKTTEIIVGSKQCDDCIKLSGNYYEAVLQIRGAHKENMLNKIMKISALRFVKPVDNGYDVRFVKKKDAANIAGALAPKAAKTFKLVGEKGGRKVYRVYYSIR